MSVAQLKKKCNIKAKNVQKNLHYLMLSYAYSHFFQNGVTTVLSIEWHSIVNIYSAIFRYHYLNDVNENQRQKRKIKNILTLYIPDLQSYCFCFCFCFCLCGAPVGVWVVWCPWSRLSACTAPCPHPAPGQQGQSKKKKKGGKKGGKIRGKWHKDGKKINTGKTIEKHGNEGNNCKKMGRNSTKL